MKTPEMKPKTENKESKREIINLEIAEKNYEVIKTHFTYPEHIIKENGGVEGYDRFRLSWEQFDEGKFDSLENTKNLQQISTSLGMNKDSNYVHFVGGVYNQGTDWSNNNFFLNKPFDFEELIKSYKNNDNLQSNQFFYSEWLIFDNYEKVNLRDYFGPPGNQNSVKANFAKFLASGKDPDTEKIIDFLKTKDLIASPGLSLAYGNDSHIKYHSLTGASDNLNKWKNPFFNFSHKSKAFDDYLKNTEQYVKKIQGETHLDLYWAQETHPKVPMIFTKDFPAFRWCMADTAYVPMKDGPNFFKFYSKDEENKNP